ncbi:MAG: hypothetical protein AB3N23_02530 [Paracoccaceae bacterium]
MKWEKLGRVYGPDGSSDWARHSALQPTPIVLDDRIRVFCAFRDDDGMGRVGFVDLDLTDPTQVLGASPNPVLDIGAPGAFDCHGVVPTAIAQRDEGLYLYYAGYLRGDAEVRFRAYCGLAISTDDGQSFQRYSTDPILPATGEETLFRVIHSLIHEDGMWKAWYGGGSDFVRGKAKSLPVYNIRYMESSDGIHFPDRGEVALDNLGEEHRVGRPYVVRNGDEYLMFFGKGSEDNPYELAFARSSDGRNWDRQDDVLGLPLSAKGWDSEMMAYPAVVAAGDQTYMFYNGNAYGRDGFGCARLVEW